VRWLIDQMIEYISEHGLLRFETVADLRSANVLVDRSGEDSRLFEARCEFVSRYIKGGCCGVGLVVGGGKSGVAGALCDGDRGGVSQGRGVAGDSEVDSCAELLSAVGDCEQYVGEPGLGELVEGVALGVRTKGQKKRGQLKRKKLRLSGEAALGEGVPQEGKLSDRRQVFGADEAVSDESVVQGRCETVLSSVPVDSGAQVPVWRRKQASGRGLGLSEDAGFGSQSEKKKKRKIKKIELPLLFSRVWKRKRGIRWLVVVLRRMLWLKSWLG